MKTLEELQELAVQMDYTLEELMYEMLCDSVDDLEQKDKEIARLNKIIDKARRFLDLTCYFNERTLTFSECNKLYNMLDKEELKEEGKE